MKKQVVLALIVVVGMFGIFKLYEKNVEVIKQRETQQQFIEMNNSIDSIAKGLK